MKISGYLYYINNLISILTTKNFHGWGRKRTGQFAAWCHKTFRGELTLHEDGFIRSLGLGVNNSPSFSIVGDTLGIYYDATAPSSLEHILNTYHFNSDITLLKTALEAIELIQKYHISKYNHASNVNDNFFKNDSSSKVLVIAQTAGDASLKYGLAEKFTTKQMIDDAINENPNSSVYVKIHPDVLTGKKSSDISMDEIPQTCTVIDEDVNPISLLKHFDKIYTKTSGMGMEALILGLSVVCYGMPYYAGWGLTQDKQKCNRRQRILKIEELFAGAYILYTQYYNPYTNKPSDIIDTIYEIIKQKNML